MSATAFPASQQRPDKPFRIAVALAVGLGLAQLAAVGVHYGLEKRAARRAAEATAPAAPSPVSTPVSQVATTATAPASEAASTAAAPPDAETQAAATAAAPTAADSLLSEARALRERGDNTTALAKLQEAETRNPANAAVLAEMASIYESIGSYERSSAAWQKLAALGPSAGPLYELADIKLKFGVAPTSNASSGPGFAGVSPLDAGSTRPDSDGIPQGSTFGIAEAALTQNPDPDAEANLTLRVSVKVRPNTIIDHTKVKIQVYFYDDNGAERPVLTDAEVNYEWITPNHDWKNTDTEVLSVSYVRLKGGSLTPDEALAQAAAGVTPPGRKPGAKKPGAGKPRTYAGYQVRVYYNDQLQDVRAEPTKLLNLYPPPLTLSSQ